MEELDDVIVLWAGMPIHIDGFNIANRIVGHGQ